MTLKTLRSVRKQTLRLAALALCSAALATTPLHAQGPRGMSPEQQQAQLDALTKAVNLTPDQVTAIKAINADQMKQMMALRESGGDPADMRPKMMALRTASQTKIKALLTDEQKPKYDAYLASMPQRGPGGPGGGAPPPPPPPQ